MCCFSRPVKAVSNTRIFARVGDKGNQVIVYSMWLKAAEESAMILPIPIKPGSGEKSVKFISLERYPRFFDDLNDAFYGVDNSFGPASDSNSRLEVHRVGSYDASFVSTVADFSRLDERFRLPAGTWDKLPQYRDFGFVVFKFRPGAATIHPMAFAFPTRDVPRLFFPTVHIHDGKGRERAKFDHALYPQPSRQGGPLHNWVESIKPAGAHVNMAASKGVVRAEHHIFRQLISGTGPNEDTWVPLGSRPS